MYPPPESSIESYTVALAGNPNVGKSTVFNALTGMHQHTGNWAGVTVSCFKGSCSSKKNNYVFADLPGTYSLMAHSAEEALARDGICFGNCDAAVVICDSTCLERNLNLVLQILETGIPAMVCVNFMDEAAKKDIHIDLYQCRLSAGNFLPLSREQLQEKSALWNIF